MSEQQNLILNLNKIMEEYAGGEEEVTLELQILSIQEERAKTRTETEQQQEKKQKEEERCIGFKNRVRGRLGSR